MVEADNPYTDERHGAVTAPWQWFPYVNNVTWCIRKVTVWYIK